MSNNFIRELMRGYPLLMCEVYQKQKQEVKSGEILQKKKMRFGSKNHMDPPTQKDGLAIVSSIYPLTTPPPQSVSSFSLSKLSKR